ncbi:MAG TPA: glycoside hydrolase, partial [Verrucomicrobiota bacterium]|nr:glycoside hydrolase [Verrucomicrobiota bacterium]
TSQTLYALANALRDYRYSTVSREDYFDAFLTYVRSQHANGKPYIGEYLDETSGAWINGRAGRSRYYNHSTFGDLLITGVVGLRPRADDQVEVDPLLPSPVWDWFCLDHVTYHGRTLTILWDRDGTRYGRGAGLQVLADGRQIARSEKLERVIGRLP